MTPDEILSIQTEANRLVFEGRKVHVEVEELNRDTLPGTQTTEGGRFVGKALPDDYTGGVKRVIVIDGVDRNPCCGTHLPSIKNLQLFLLPHTESLTRSSSNTTSTRLYFLAGPRLITHLTSTHSLLTAISSLLSCGAPLVPDRVALVVDERKKAEKRSQDVEEELAKYVAADLHAEIEKTEKTLFVKHVHRIDDSSSALAFLSTISTHLAAKASTDKSYLVVLSSTPSSLTSTSTSVVLVFGSDEALVKKVGDQLKTAVGIKGGGKGLKWSGKFTGVWKDAKEGSAIQKVLESV